MTTTLELSTGAGAGAGVAGAGTVAGVGTVGVLGMRLAFLRTVWNRASWASAAFFSFFSFCSVTRKSSASRCDCDSLEEEELVYGR